MASASDKPFFKAQRLFPLALGTGAERNGMSMPKQNLSSRHFQRKISEFCEVRIAPIASKQVLVQIPMIYRTVFRSNTGRDSENSPDGIPIKYRTVFSSR